MAASDCTFQGQEFKPTDLLPYIQSPSGKQAIELRSLDIHVVVTGLYSEIIQTMNLSDDRWLAETTLVTAATVDSPAASARIVTQWSEGR